MSSITLLQIERLRAVLGITVTVTRGSGEDAQSCELVAVPSASKAQVVGSDGSFTEVIIDDWIIVKGDWTLTEPAEPTKGDMVTVDESTKYLVGHPDEKTPAFNNFNPLDRPALAWVVHSVPR